MTPPEYHKTGQDCFLLGRRKFEATPGHSCGSPAAPTGTRDETCFQKRGRRRLNSAIIRHVLVLVVSVPDYERIPYSPMCMLHNRMCHGPPAFVLSATMLGQDAPDPVLKTGANVREMRSAPSWPCKALVARVTSAGPRAKAAGQREPKRRRCNNLLKKVNSTFNVGYDRKLDPSANLFCAPSRALIHLAFSSPAEAAVHDLLRDKGETWATWHRRRRRCCPRATMASRASKASGFVLVVAMIRTRFTPHIHLIP